MSKINIPAVAWQMRTKMGDRDWRRWEECADRSEGDPREVVNGPMVMQFRPLYAAPVASRAVQAEPVWFEVETPGADFDVSFVSTMEEALQLNEGDPDAPSYITPLYDHAPTAPAAIAEPTAQAPAQAGEVAQLASKARVLAATLFDGMKANSTEAFAPLLVAIDRLAALATPPAQPVLAPVVREPLTDAQIIALHHPFDGAVTLARKIEKAHGINGELTVPDLTNSSRKALADHVLNIVYSYAEAALNCRYFEEKKGPLDQWRERDHDVYEARVRKIEAQNWLNYVVRDAIERAHGIQATTGEQSHG